MKRVLMVLCLAACSGPGALPPTSSASCMQNSECTLPFCPSQCGGGQPFCGVPRAYGVTEARQACPCLTAPNGAGCTPPSGCAIPDCAQNPDVPGAFAACVGGKCVTRLADGGAPP